MSSRHADREDHLGTQLTTCKRALTANRRETQRLRTLLAEHKANQTGIDNSHAQAAQYQRERDDARANAAELRGCLAALVDAVQTALLPGRAALARATPAVDKPLPTFEDMLGILKDEGPTPTPPALPKWEAWDSDPEAMMRTLWHNLNTVATYLKARDEADL